MTAQEMPFSSASYRLSSCELKSMADRDAESVAAALAAIDPWRRMAYTEILLQKKCR